MATEEEPDAALMRAWKLRIEDHTDGVIDEFEPLIPILVPRAMPKQMTTRGASRLKA